MKRMTGPLTWLFFLFFHLPGPALAVERIPDISDLIPAGGEEKARDSIYDRWVATVEDPGHKAMVDFIDRNFVIRDGESWASGSSGSRHRLSIQDVLDVFAKADVVFFGETHDSAGAHLLEVFLTRLLHERVENLVVCMEMFERQAQPILDDYLGGKIDEKTFLARIQDPGIKGFWSNYHKDYRPVIEFCRKQGIPVEAGFPPRRLAAQMSRKGKKAFYAGLSDEDRGLCAKGLVEPVEGSYRESCMRSFDGMADFRRGSMLGMVEKDLSKLERLKPMILGTGGGMGRGMSPSSEKLFISQLLKDCTMAETIVGILESRPGSKVIAIAGSGHVRNGGGAVGVLRVIAPDVKMTTSMFVSPRIAAPPEKPTGIPVDVLFLGDRIRTYEQKMPKGVSLDEARRRIEEFEKFALLEIYRGNDKDQRDAMANIEKVRGLKYKYPVNARIMTTEEARDEVGGWAGSEEARAWYDTQEKVLRGFKLFKGGISLSRKQSGKRQDSIMGFYRPTDKTLYLFPQRAGKKKLRGLRVHETIHALQDQHFDLTKLHASVVNSDDDAALTALIEGEAVFLMMKVLGMNKGLSKMLHGSKGGGGGGMSSHGSAGGMKAKKPQGPPDYFGERTKLMYRCGAQFLKKLVEAGGWERVTQAFLNRPRTTHEILHPEEYLKGFRPELPQLPTVEEGWKELRQDQLGEADFSIVLKLNGISPKEASDAASSWRGDAYRLVSSTDEENLHRLVFLSTWASKEAAGLAADLLLKVFGDAKIEARGRKLAMVREFRIGESRE